MQTANGKRPPWEWPAVIGLLLIAFFFRVWMLNDVPPGHGGVAVHENLFRLRGLRSAHLLALDEERLVAAALVVGCQPHWIQRTRTLHFDLVGESLVRALIRCGIDPAHPPARSVWRPL